jgi:DNA-binding GntR family transcriptional regulator
MTTIACQTQMIFAVLREPSKRRRYDSASDIPGLQGNDPVEAERMAQELIDLGLIARDHGRFTIIDWSIDRIVEHLALAGAIQALAAAQVAGMHGKADFGHLEALNSALKTFDNLDPANLLQGAYIDYQWHLELVRIGGNRAALAVYAKAVPPAVWIAGANYFQLDEARSSLVEHDRLVAYMKAGDTLRARDAISFHFEEAAAQIRCAGAARIESYPSDRPNLAQA